MAGTTRAQPVSTSLDAVAALQAEVLPGWNTHSITRMPDTAYVAVMERYDPIGFVHGQAPTECGARLAAILKAYSMEKTT